MPNFIDRRLNPKDKSLGNRQRFLKRAREELKRTIKERVKSGKIADVDAEQNVSMSHERKPMSVGRLIDRHRIA